MLTPEADQRDRRLSASPKQVIDSLAVRSMMSNRRKNLRLNFDFNMNEALELLNLILAKSHPHDTIRLPIHQARILATLNERELGRSLLLAISAIGVGAALEQEGLFSRNIVISFNDAEGFVVVQDAKT